MKFITAGFGIRLWDPQARNENISPVHLRILNPPPLKNARLRKGPGVLNLMRGPLIRRWRIGTTD
jgi:hypothetical protein